MKGSINIPTLQYVTPRQSNIPEVLQTIPEYSYVMVKCIHPLKMRPKDLNVVDVIDVVDVVDVVDEIE
mgnify:FL=1